MPLLATSGCTSALVSALWLIKGPNIPAKCTELRGKRVAVVCRPVTTSLYSNPGVAKDLARKISRLLAREVHNIDVMDQQKVDDWIDTNMWDEYNYPEIGEALEVDLVVGIDLEHFNIYQSQTLYQGKAHYTIQVYECASGDLVYEEHPRQSVYPPNHSIPTQDRQESDFRREFVGVLADEIARHFYPHDPRAYFAFDATAID
jgi:hypothetical protein